MNNFRSDDKRHVEREKDVEKSDDKDERKVIENICAARKRMILGLI